MTETMIERCARALWDSWQASEVVTDKWRGISWDTIRPVPNAASLAVRRAADSEVRAVLLALREPSKGMKLAGETALENATVDDYDNEDNPCGSHVYAAAHTTIFQAMIDAALAETEKP